MWEIFATHADMTKHMDYHCNQEENAYRNNCEEGIINRRTPYGFGVPNIDKRLFGGKAFFDVLAQTWNCLICNFARDKYQRRQVFGHIAATHGYTSRIPNERWVIPIEDKYQEANTTNTIKTSSAEEEEVQTEPTEQQRIRTKHLNGQTTFICGYCDKEKTKRTKYISAY